MELFEAKEGEEWSPAWAAVVGRVRVASADEDETAERLVEALADVVRGGRRGRRGFFAHHFGAPALPQSTSGRSRPGAARRLISLCPVTAKSMTEIIMTL